MASDKDTKDTNNKLESITNLLDHGTQSPENARRQWIVFLNAWSIEGQFASEAEVKQHHLNPWLKYKQFQSDYNLRTRALGTLGVSFVTYGRWSLIFNPITISMFMMPDFYSIFK